MCPPSKFLQESTYFLFGYRSFAAVNEMLALLNAALENPSPNPRLWEFVHVWVKVLSEKDTNLLQKLLQLKNIPQNISNDIKLMLLRKGKKSGSAVAEGAQNVGFGNLLSSEWTAAQVAEALTNAEAPLFYSVTEEEFLDKAFASDNRAVRAPNLSKLAARFNSVSFWVASQVLLHGGSSSKQVQMCCFLFLSFGFIQLALSFSELSRLSGSYPSSNAFVRSTTLTV